MENFKEVTEKQSLSDFNFIEIQKYRYSRSDLSNVYIRFIDGKKNKYSNRVYIGIPENVANEVGFKRGDKVSISYDQKNPRVFYLKKGLKGFLLSKNKGSNVLYTSCVWNVFKPRVDELKSIDYQHEVVEGGLLLW